MDKFDDLADYAADATVDAAKDADLERRIAAAERIAALVEAHGREIAALRSGIDAAFGRADDACAGCGESAKPDDCDSVLTCDGCGNATCERCFDRTYAALCSRCAEYERKPRKGAQ